VPIEGTHLIAYSDTVINPDILPYLNEAADAYYDLSNGKNIIVADAVRTVRDQATKFYNNCIRNGGICSPPTCNPTVPSDGLVKKVDDKYTLTGELANVPVTDAATIINALTTHGNVGNCNHTSGYALDLWPEGHLPNFINNVDDMELLVQVMTDHGFCRLKSEVWHFEFINTGVTLSKNCDTDYSDLTYYRDGKPITPDPECTYWDFNNNHECVDGKLR